MVTDPLLLERIVSNLVANAARYTSEGGVLVACRRRGERARIEVWDTGAGVPAGELDRIFDEFYQARAPLADRAKGLGLGLAIVKRLAQLLELEIEVRSIEGRGSLFAIVVPLAESVAQTAVAERALPPGPMRFDGALALVVDDDRDAREALAGLLREWGWRVITAEGGDQTLVALGDKPPHLDVIITDYRLAAEGLGTQVIERVRTAYGANIPAIVVSGDVTADLRESTQAPACSCCTSRCKPRSCGLCCITCAPGTRAGRHCRQVACPLRLALRSDCLRRPILSYAGLTSTRGMSGRTRP